MGESYRSKVQGAARQAYLKAVVRQPTQASNVKVKVDPNSPSGIRRVPDHKG
jgi:hypothetical protein